MSPQGPLKAATQKTGSSVGFGTGVGSQYQQAYGGFSFSGGNQVAATVTAALATTYTGLCLSNPAGSGKNLVVQGVSVLETSSAISMVGLITGWAAGGITVHTTSLDADIVNDRVDGGTYTSVAHLDAACTLVGTPIWKRWLTAIPTTTSFGIDKNLDEGLIIGPGGYVAVGSLLSTTGVLASFKWAER
jgi:hypothetical protein